MHNHIRKYKSILGGLKKLGWQGLLGTLVFFINSQIASSETTPAPTAKITATATAASSKQTEASAKTATAESPTINSRQPLSFSFQQISTRALLQLIAQNAGLNFVISDSIKGNMTLSLQNVTWQQALDIVLRSNGLSSRQFGSVIMIAPIDELATSEAKEYQAEQQLADLAPPVSEVIRLTYANAESIAEMLRGGEGGAALLSAKGQVSADARTNSIWIRDTPTSLAQIKQFIKQVDIPAKQVLIEARVVSVDTAYAKELGVAFGMSRGRHVTGTLAGANQIANGTQLGEVTPFTDRLNFSLPATTNDILGANTVPGTFGVALFKIGGSVIDLELSALEGENHAKIISKPRVITSNAQKALIETGEEIPYQESTSSGATSIAFRKAVLSLEIVPQITADKRILLTVRVTQNKRGTNTVVSTTATTTTSIPAIDTQEVQSNVLLDDGETVVVGGVYKQTKVNSVQRIPFFGELPLVGALFRHKGESLVRTELLIFLTPKIVDSTAVPTENATAAATG